MVSNQQFIFCMDKAAYQVSLKFPINKAELYCLNRLSHFLQMKNKTIISKVEFFKHVTGNSKNKRYLQGYMSGLLARGYVGQFEYVSSPESECVGISDLGIVVLTEFDKQMDEAFERFRVSPYRIYRGLPPSFIEEPGTRYKVA